MILSFALTCTSLRFSVPHSSGNRLVVNFPPRPMRDLSVRLLGSDETNPSPKKTSSLRRAFIYRCGLREENSGREAVRSNSYRGARKVEKPREETPCKENEIRITAQGRMPGYIFYATSLLQEKGSNKVVFNAMGRAINKTVLIAELMKRRIDGLHQNTAIGSIEITDSWEPLEEGLLPLETTRHVSIITITLSMQELDNSSVGYQSPLSAEQMKPSAQYDNEGVKTASNRSRGRGIGIGTVIVHYGNGGRNNKGRQFRWNGSGRGGGHDFGGCLFHQLEVNFHLEEPPAPSKGQGRRRNRALNQGRGQDARANGPIKAGAAEA